MNKKLRIHDLKILQNASQGRKFKPLLLLLHFYLHIRKISSNLGTDTNSSF